MYLGIIRNQIAKQLKKKINKYDILLNVTNKRLKFIIEGKEYDFPDKNMMDVIEKAVKTQVATNDATIDAIQISFDDSQKDIGVKVFCTDIKTKEKSFITKNI